MRYLTVILLASVVMSCASPAYSHRTHAVNVDAVNVEVVSDSSGRLRSIPHKEYRQSGSRVVKEYLEARRGDNYSIVVRNRLPERVGVVIAVDGRNIISGGKSFLGSNERMYILDPYGSATLEGWRTDLQSVNRFYFTDVADSYAVRTFGDTSAMGVISVAVFRERERRVYRYGQEMKKERAPAPARESAGKSLDQEAGTGFGDKRYSPVEEVAFEPEAVPLEKVLLKYEWREVLCRKGILSCWSPAGNRLWDDNAFAPYPPDYRVH
jgi:hypothetical protein